MKKLIATSVLLAAWVRCFAVAPEMVATTNDLALIPNPNTTHFLTFVASDSGAIGDGSSGMWAWVKGASNAPPGVVTLQSLTHPGEGLFLKCMLGGIGGGGTNIFNITVVTNLYVVTNLFVNNEYVTNSYITNLFVTYEVVSNLISGNIQGTPPHLGMFFPDNFSISDSIVTQNADTNGITVNGNGDGSITLSTVNPVTLAQVGTGFSITNSSGRGLFLDSPSGYTGSGTLALTDDGTFKPFAGSADTLWTNLSGVLQPKDLTLPVMITNQLSFSQGMTNLLFRQGSLLMYENSRAGLVVTNGATYLKMHLNNGTVPTITASGATYLGVPFVTDDFQPKAGSTYRIGALDNSNGDYLYAYVHSNIFKAFDDGTATNRVGMTLSMAGPTAVFNLQAKTNNVPAPITGFSLETNSVVVATLTGAGVFPGQAPVTLVESTATTIVNVGVPAGAYVGGTLVVSIFASDAGGEMQTHTSGMVHFAAVNKGGTITAAIAEAAAGEVNANTTGSNITDAYTIVQNGNSVDIKVNAVSSLAQTTFTATTKVTALNSNGAYTVTMP